MNDPITAEQIFDAAIRLQICEKQSLEIDFFPDKVRVRLPPKRVLAEFCSMPMAKITAIFSEMERDQLIGAEQRGGMWVSSRGNRIIADLLKRKYRNEAEVVLGPVVMKTLLERLL